MKLYKILVTGRVQGVGFRRAAANEAIVRGLNGFVKNLPDGSVYIEAEGPVDQLDSYLEWCRKGPGMSNVRSISVERSEPSGYDDFRIEHQYN